MQSFRRYFARDPDKVARADAALTDKKIPHLRETVASTIAPGITANSLVSVAVTADGQRAISAAKNACLTLWELPSGRPLHTIRVTQEPFLVAPEISGTSSSMYFARSAC